MARAAASNRQKFIQFPMCDCFTMKVEAISNQFDSLCARPATAIFRPNIALYYIRLQLLKVDTYFVNNERLETWAEIATLRTQPKEWYRILLNEQKEVDWKKSFIVYLYIGQSKIEMCGKKCFTLRRLKLYIASILNSSIYCPRFASLRRCINFTRLVSRRPLGTVGSKCIYIPFFFLFFFDLFPISRSTLLHLVIKKIAIVDMLSKLICWWIVR